MFATTRNLSVVKDMQTSKSRNKHVAKISCTKVKEL